MRRHPRAWITHISPLAAGEPDLRLHVREEGLRHPRDIVEIIERVEAVLALAVGDHPGRLGHREAEIPQLLEGRLVEVDLVALVGLGLLGRRDERLWLALLGLRIRGVLGLLLRLLPLVVLLLAAADAEDRAERAAEDSATAAFLALLALLLLLLLRGLGLARGLGRWGDLEQARVGAVPRRRGL